MVEIMKAGDAIRRAALERKRPRSRRRRARRRSPPRPRSNPPPAGIAQDRRPADHRPRPERAGRQRTLDPGRRAEERDRYRQERRGSRLPAASELSSAVEEINRAAAQYHERPRPDQSWRPAAIGRLAAIRRRHRSDREGSLPSLRNGLRTPGARQRALGADSGEPRRRRRLGPGRFPARSKRPTGAASRSTPWNR